MIDRQPAAVAPVRTIPELFRAQVARTPELVAIASGDGSVTYAELSGRVNQLARWLVAHGTGAGAVVALSMARSVDLVVAQLAVVTAGAAYLPLDPAYPPARQRHMLRDSGAALVLTDGQPAAAAPAEPRRVDLRDPATIARIAACDPDELSDLDRSRPVDPRDPAYVIYTSGSTGAPKGVLVSHRGVASLLASGSERMVVARGSRVLQFASPSFDVAFWELCISLFTGGTLVLAPADRLVPGRALAALVAEAGISHLTLPPSALAVLPPGALPAGLTLMVAGEECPAHLASTWAPGRRMLNGYGPTESTVLATISEPLPAGQRPPIGTPVAGTRAYVLDPSLAPVPAGAAGELYLAGAGLAIGYLGRPDLTAERFLPDPYGPPGSRMYRTGDLAALLTGGALDYLGRVDDQVQIRGFRVEVAEVESGLVNHPAVARAAVIARDGPAGKELVACVVARPGSAPQPAELREHLSRELPDHLLPSAFVLLNELPVTPNGKLDRRTLATLHTGPEFYLRGFRIAPARVAAALRAHPRVADAVVTAGRDGAGGGFLGAYLAVPSEVPLDLAELREFAAGRLPEHAVPTAFAQFTELPKGPTGEVDRAALPPLQPGESSLRAAFVAPRDSLEERLARIWEEVFHLEGVGVHDNFFALGGHSLLGLQMLARIEDLLDVEIPLPALIDAPTVGELTPVVEARLVARLGEPA